MPHAVQPVLRALIPLSLLGALAACAAASAPQAAAPPPASAFDASPVSAAGLLARPSGGGARTAAAPADAGDAAAAPSDAESVTVPFGRGAALSREAGAVLDRVARLYRTAGPEAMFVAGRDVRSGPGPRREMDALQASARRAAAVKAGLVARGIPASRLMIVALGQSEYLRGRPPARSAVITWRLSSALSPG